MWILVLQALTEIFAIKHSPCQIKTLMFYCWGLWLWTQILFCSMPSARWICRAHLQIFCIWRQPVIFSLLIQRAKAVGKPRTPCFVLVKHNMFSQASPSFSIFSVYSLNLSSIVSWTEITQTLNVWFCCWNVKVNLKQRSLTFSQKSLEWQQWPCACLVPTLLEPLPYLQEQILRRNLSLILLVLWFEVISILRLFLPLKLHMGFFSKP